MTRMRRPGQNDLSGAFRFPREWAADAGNTARPPKSDSVPPGQRRDTGRSVAPKPTIRLPPPISFAAGNPTPRRTKTGTLLAAQQRPQTTARAAEHPVASPRNDTDATCRTTATAESRTRRRELPILRRNRHRPSITQERSALLPMTTAPSPQPTTGPRSPPAHTKRAVHTSVDSPRLISAATAIRPGPPYKAGCTSGISPSYPPRRADGSRAA